MKGKILNIITILLLLANTSCDNYLTELNPNYKEESEYWKNLQEVNRGLSAVYASLRNSAVLNIREEAFRSDMAWPGAGRPIPESQGDEYNCYVHNYNNSSIFIKNKWEACYAGIFRANQVIRALNRLKPTLDSKDGEKWRTLMGQARFFRGLYHFYLHSAFNKGNIILIDEIPLRLEDFHKPLSSSEEVMKFFREDLRYAYENLPVSYSDAGDLGRITSGAAATILGTSYLYEFSDTKDDNTLDMAMDLFRYVIYDCGYELVQNPDELFNEDYELNSESILEIVYSEDIRPEMGDWNPNNFIQHLAFYTTQWNSGHLLPAWLANAYQTEKIDEKDPRNHFVQKTVNPDGTITETDAVRKISLRASSMVAVWEDVYTPWYLKPNVAEANINFQMSTNGFGYYKKFSDCKTKDKDEQKSGMNIVINRLSEVYLMYAECLIEKGDVNEALKYINEVRKRWGLVLLGQPFDADRTYDGLPYDAKTLMTHLREVEKPLELSLEGHMTRWIDLRRWGMLESNFKKLSEAVYYAVNPSVITPEGKSINMHVTKFGVVRNAAEIKAHPQEYRLIDFEYDKPYQMFDYERHAYYPIPMSEIEKNPNIKQ